MRARLSISFSSAVGLLSGCVATADVVGLRAVEGEDAFGGSSSISDNIVDASRCVTWEGGPFVAGTRHAEYRILSVKRR